MKSRAAPPKKKGENMKNFTEKEKELILKLIPEQRILMISQYGVVNHEKKLYLDSRFKDDKRVLYEMSRGWTDKLSLEESICSALMDCADWDYYYMFEKDYGGEDE